MVVMMKELLSSAGLLGGSLPTAAAPVATAVRPLAAAFVAVARALPGIGLQVWSQAQGDVRGN